jgi:replicative DNA helicase
MIYNYELEQHLISGIIKYPDKLFEISSFISEKDFFSESSLINKSLFFVLKQAIEKGEVLDELLISEKVKSLGISFEEGIETIDYVRSLQMRQVSEKSIMETAKELKKVSIRREIAKSGMDLTKAMKSSNLDSYNDIISKADAVYNNIINFYDSGENIPENLYEGMEEFIEGRGNEPINEFGLTGPHQRLQEIYGSLLCPGNITVIVARSGIGKTQFCMDFCTKASSINENVPILHFDNGEMSKEELTLRQCAALSGVQLSLLQTGQWRHAGEDVVKKVRAVWKKIKEMKFYYFNCGGLSTDEMLTIVRKFYFSKVGRGNQMILSFDYIKTTFASPNSSKNEWQIVGEMIDKFKKLIMNEITPDGKPVVSMITSVQMNRLGTSRNRSEQNIVEDETVVSLSDRIIQFCSDMFILRSKEPEEIASHANFGTHKLVSLKNRDLGQNPQRALQPVRMLDGSLRRNFINLDFNNFNITERGDLVDLVEHLRVQDIEPEEDGTSDLPLLFSEDG